MLWIVFSLIFFCFFCSFLAVFTFWFLLLYWRDRLLFFGFLSMFLLLFAFLFFNLLGVWRVLLLLRLERLVWSHFLHRRCVDFILFLILLWGDVLLFIWWLSFVKLLIFGEISNWCHLAGRLLTAAGFSWRLIDAILCHRILEEIISFIDIEAIGDITPRSSLQKI